MKTFTDRFESWFTNLDEDEQKSVYNEYADNCGHERINYIEEFDEVTEGIDRFRIACMVRYGEFNPTHPYFTFDGYGNIETIENLSSWLEDYVSDLANWYEDRQRTLVDLMGIEVTYIYVETEIEAIPTWALCYLVNGDASALTDEEVDMIDKWLDKSEYSIISPCEGEEGYFTSFPAFGLACEVIDCECR